MSEWSARVLSALQGRPCRHLSLYEKDMTVEHVGPFDPSFAAPPRPPRARPEASFLANPEAGVGCNWSLGKTARSAGLKAVTPEIPHRSTRLGVQAKRKDSPHTHRRQSRASFLQPMARPFIPPTAALNSNSVRMPGSNGAASDQSECYLQMF